MINDDRPLDEEDDEPLYDGPSRSQKKREAEAMQKLGAELTKLPADAFERVAGLPDDIREAVIEYRRIKSFGAVREAIDRATGASRAAAAAHQRAERLRDALMADDAKLTDYVASHPDADVQKLRTLIRQARKERDAAKPPKYFRELYRFLHTQELPELSLEKSEDEEEDGN